MKIARAAWLYLVNWFECADLVPLLILVSAVHYASVLATKDPLPVAVAIGLLVDLGHYRTIRAAVRYAGSSKAQTAARWAIAAGMTALSLSYHQRYYQDWWLSAPLPLLIAALAWLQQISNPVGAARQQGGSKPPTAEKPIKPAEQPLYRCECGYVAKSQAGLNGHKRRHSSKALLKQAGRGGG